MTALRAKAKRFGIQPGDYARRLIEEGLVFQREAEESTFAKIMDPVRTAAGSVEDAEIIALVEKSRTKRRTSSRKKR